MKESASVRFLYHTIIGRFILMLLVQPWVSKVAGVYLSSRLSTWLVPIFIKNNHIDMSRYQEPAGGFTSFNQFFTRLLQVQLQLPSADLISPCDGLLTIKEIDDDSVFYVKNCHYSLAQLLNNPELAARYSGGTALIFRLTPSHYHHYIYGSAGQLVGSRRIDGILHCVRPIAVEGRPVYCQNSREYTIMDTSMGTVVQMEVGAMLVGKISNIPISDGTAISVGDEKGYFEYGGSTIILLLEGRPSLNPAILNREKEWDEIPVTIGESLI